MNRVSKEAAVAQIVRHSLWVILAAGVVFFLNLGVPQLWDEDEPKNGACAREMLERNDWVVPMFNYELRTAKPVLLYWFMMSAYELFGVNEFGARFWSAVLGIGTCLLAYGIGRRLFQPAVGLWSALILAAALMFGVASRAATPDAPLIFFSTLALALFVYGLPASVMNVRDVPSQDPQLSACNSLRQAIPNAWSIYFLMYGAMALAVLAKGPVGVALPTLIIMGYLWLRHRNSQLATTQSVTYRSWMWELARQLSPVAIWRIGWVLRPLTAILMVAVIALPWYVWVGWRTDGAWIEGFLGKHNVGRFVQPLEGHSGPIFYYVIAVMIGFFPWSIFLPLACFRLWQRLRNPALRTVGDEFCAAWAVIYIGFFSLASTKLPSYVLPAYPALALITGRWVVEWMNQPAVTPRWLTRSGFANFAVVGLAFLIAIPIVTARFMPHTWYLGWAGLIPLVGGIAAVVQLERGRASKAVQLFGVCALLFPVCLFGIVAVQVNPHQTSAALMTAIFQQSRQPQIATFDYFEPSLAYYAAQPVSRLKTAEQAAKFLHDTPDSFLIVRDKDLQQIRESASGLRVVERRQRFLKSGQVVLVTMAASNVAKSGSTKSGSVNASTIPRPVQPRTAGVDKTSK